MAITVLRFAHNLRPGFALSPGDGRDRAHARTRDDRPRSKSRSIGAISAISTRRSSISTACGLASSSRRSSTGHDDRRGVRALLFHDRKESRGVLGMESDAAVRSRPAETADLVAAMYGVAAVEEDRVWHGRIVICSRKPRPLQPLRTIGAAGCPVSGSARGHDKMVARRAIDINGHLLGALVHRDKDICAGRGCA